MNSRAEVTTRYAKAYVKAAKGDKGRILDEVVGVTGWSRDNARRRLCVAARRPPRGGGRQGAKAIRSRRSPKYSRTAVNVLQRAWAASGGKYVAAAMCIRLDGPARHRELVERVDRCGLGAEGDLLALSAASID